MDQFEYKTIAATDINTFDAAVNKAFGEGWQRAGILIVTPDMPPPGSRDFGMQYTLPVIRQKGLKRPA